MTKAWMSLQKGDLVDVIAPASACSPEELRDGVDFLKSWGLRVRVPPRIFGSERLHAQSDSERWRQLRAALLAPDSKAVWCVRGGYGSMKLLPPLAQMKVPVRTKLFLGLSDITSLHLFFIQKWKWPVLHAPILSRLGRYELPRASTEELKEVIFGQRKEVSFELEPLNRSAQKAKPLKGRILGGNWTTLMASLATPYQVKPKGCFLFLEDVGERAYRLDRYWEQLKQAGLWEQVEAVLLGDLTEGNEPDGSNGIGDVVERRAQELKKPVFRGIPAGHGPIQRTIPLGVMARVETTLSSKQLILPTGCRL